MKMNALKDLMLFMALTDKASKGKIKFFGSFFKFSEFFEDYKDASYFAVNATFGSKAVEGTEGCLDEDYNPRYTEEVQEKIYFHITPFNASCKIIEETASFEFDVNTGELTFCPVLTNFSLENGATYAPQNAKFTLWLKKFIVEVEWKFSRSLGEYHSYFDEEEKAEFFKISDEDKEKILRYSDDEECLLKIEIM
jgi:hypothetical protein